mmetsp:Transcript_16233/g.26375  ORF Transcript_16233/g.26375 Transcript_16233/m.26375 type:complete len:332 (-) Transcript_16233:114-1109(-)
MTILILILILFLRTTEGSSAGGVFLGYCWDARDAIGCDPRNFVDGNHLKCSSAYGPMSWAGRPVYSSAFSLRTGIGPKSQDPTFYRPGEWMDIYLTVENYSQKYRGLALHAYNKTHSHIGLWSTTDSTFQFNRKWVSPEPGCIMHAQGDLKPLRTRFRFKGPPAGTGNITFQALIKVGPANEGWFYYPNGLNENLEGEVPPDGFPGNGVDLLLAEGPTRTLPWVQGHAGQSCDSVCVSIGKQCDEAAMRTPSASSPGGIQAKLNAVEFSLPFAASCNSIAPAQDIDGSSWYNAANLNDDIATTVCNSLNEVKTKTQCGNSHRNARRFCACS